MTKSHSIRPNLLGALSAEVDGEMLSRAYLETDDYRTLIETSDRIIVVGRRGTGKSALNFLLEKYWSGTKSINVVKLAPDEPQVIGIRPLVKSFGDKFSRVRAGSRLVWFYALMMETIHALSPHYTFSALSQFDFLNRHATKWLQRGPSTCERFRNLMKEVVAHSESPEERISNLPIVLDLTKIEKMLAEACDQVNANVVFLIDRLDEGYEPDDTGIGLIDGLVQAAIDVKTRVKHVRPLVFLRDNIFRAVEEKDPDYSRNIEGHVLRLHWDEGALLDFAARRLKIAFNVDENHSTRIWNLFTTEELRGHDGFAKCLRQTLYRPRDLLSLLNEAFFTSGKRARTQISLQDLEATAEIISKHRFDDLRKEYEAILPGLSRYLSIFQGQPPELDVTTIETRIQDLLNNGSEDSRIQQDFLILEDAKSVVRGLYSIGFLGVRDAATGKFVYCHDGRAPDRELIVGDTVLIHPCYWMALNCTKREIEKHQAEEIYDEYDIDISSRTPEIRARKITELIQQLDAIPEAQEGDTQFENWCHRAVRICFAKSLRNVELKGNRNAQLRRDIVASNRAEFGVWKRIYETYATRQVVFEVKNYKQLTAHDYQQVQSYLSGEYGRLAFVITRDESIDLFSKRDVDWVREMYLTHKVLIIKLTGKYLTRLLYKLRNPQRHDDIDDAVHKLIDTYVRLYIAGQTQTEASEEKRRRRQQRLLERHLAKQARTTA